MYDPQQQRNMYSEKVSEDVMRATSSTTVAPSGAQVPMTQAAPQEFFSRSAGSSDVDSLQVKRLMRIFRRHWLMILMFAVVFGGSMVMYEMVLNTKRVPEWIRIGPQKSYQSSIGVEQVQSFTGMQVNLGAINIKPISVNLDNLPYIFSDEVFRNKYLEVLKEDFETIKDTLDQTTLDLMQRYIGGEGVAWISTSPVYNGWTTISSHGTYPQILPILLNSMPRAMNEYGKINRASGIDKTLNRLNEMRRKNQIAIAANNRVLRDLNEKLDELLPKGENADEKLLDQDKQQMEEMQNTRISLDSQMARLQETIRYKELADYFHLKDEDDAIKVLVETNPLRVQWKTLEDNLETMATRYTDDHPQIQSVREDIEVVKQKLIEGGYVTSLGKLPPLPNEWQLRAIRQLIDLRAKVLVNRDEIMNMEKRIEELKAGISAASKARNAAIKSENALDYMNRRDAIRTELGILSQKAMSMTQQIGELQSAKVQFEEEVEFAEKAQAGPAVLIGPRWWVDVPVALALGLMIGCGLAFLSETTDNRLHTPMDVYYHLRLNYLGVVPLWSEREQMVIPPERPDSHIAEVYAHLCNNIRYGRDGNPERRLLVVSATQAEGKSTTAANMAIRYALEGNQVLIIDADMRRPKVHKVLGAYHGGHSNMPGLSDYLAGASTAKEVISPSQIPGLSVIWAGSRVRNPAKLLGGGAMEALLQEAEHTFDVIIVDCPAVLPVVDATILAPHMAGVLLVIAAEEVELGAVRMAMYRLQHVGAPILGAVLNKVCERSTSYTYYGYRYRAGYYYSPYSKTYGEKDDTSSMA